MLNRSHQVGQARPRNTDGIDLSASHAYLADDDITCGDDNIAMGGDYIDIENCAFGLGHGCSIGSITRNGASYITVPGCRYTGTTAGLRLKSARGRGGLVQYLAYNDNTMTGVTNPIWKSSYYPKEPVDSLQDPAQTLSRTTPTWEHIQIHNLVATGSSNAGALYGLLEQKISDVTVDDVTIAAGIGMRIYCAASIVFQGGSSIVAAKGAAVTSRAADVKGIVIAQD